MKLKHWGLTIAVSGIVLFVWRGIAHEADVFRLLIHFAAETLKDEMVLGLLGYPWECSS